MEKVDFISITNKVRMSSKYAIALDQIFTDIFDKVPKTRIHFGSYAFGFEGQKSIPGVVVNEHVINSLFHGMHIGSFDYIYLYSDNEVHVYFSRPCADRAYALYMFYKEGYRIEKNDLSIVNADLQGMTFNELPLNLQRAFRNAKICANEYNVHKGSLTNEEYSMLRKYLDEC